ncbi:hypothetical protein FDP41_002424 [Naegleria fowleri]|uniref:Uncharacterized protein n=1 Tax=Naegleria fowleri TaxID=5763 RepID=A0A6A5BWC8_NAEFO|nr:uncharacterized protein FDP41_002424 [Naegleria fowleri]KAF0978604.1 hypothetical protein FDP41_002424 [Naegleria fowleri]
MNTKPSNALERSFASLTNTILSSGPTMSPAKNNISNSTFVTNDLQQRPKPGLSAKEKQIVQQIKLQKNIPSGLLLAASFTSAEEVIEKNLLQVDEEQKVSLSLEDIQVLFKAKCVDQNLQYIPEREDRFIDLIQKNCSGLLFSLREHGLADESAKALRKILANNRTYTILDLCGNRLRDTGTIELAPLLEDNQTIVRLDLRSNDIGGKGAKALFNALLYNQTLTSLDLSGLSGINRNHISTKGAKHLSELLQQNQTLCQLNLASNGMGADGIKILCRGLVDNFSLTELDISSNNIGTAGCESLARVLDRTNLQKLSMERNQIGNKGVFVMCEKMKTMLTPTLTYWDLSENRITSEGVEVLVDMLKVDKSLKTLRIECNEFGDKGAEDFAQLLEVNKTLKKLMLGENAIGDEGAKEIGKGLAMNRTLKTLFLNNNLIKDTGAKRIIRGLNDGTKLKHLDLSYNRIGDRAGVEIARMLTTNETLRTLNLKQNELKTSGDQISDAMRKNFTLINFDFSFNDFSYKSFSYITEALKRNEKLLKSNEVERLKKKIELLQDTELRLVEVNDNLEKEKEEEIILYKELEDSEYELLRVRQQSQQQLDRLQEELEAKKTLTFEKEKEYRTLVESIQEEKDLFEDKCREIIDKTDSERRRVEELKKTKQAMDREIAEQLKFLANETVPLLESLKTEENNYMKEKQKTTVTEKELYLLARRVQKLSDELYPQEIVKEEIDSRPSTSSGRRPSVKDGSRTTSTKQSSASRSRR